MLIQLILMISIFINVLLGVLVIILKQEIKEKKRGGLTEEEIKWLRRRLMRIKEMEGY